MKEKELKFLFFTDPHYTAKNPISRKDNYFESLCEKTQEIVELSKELKVDAVLIGGDFFDSPDISDNIAAQVGKMYMDFKAPVYVIAGNHDLRGNNYSTLPQTKLGLLGKLGIINILEPYEPVIFKDGNVTVQLSGMPSNFGQTEQDLILKEKDAMYSIHMIHAMLLQYSDSFNYIPISLVEKETLADITLCGHHHIGSEIYKSPDGKYFINNGALIRQSSLLDEITRTIKVVLLTFKESGIEIEEIPLTCVKDGDSVLDRSKLEHRFEFNLRINQFSKQIQEREVFVRDVNQAIMQLNADDDVKQEALKRLEEAERNIKGGIVDED